IVDFYCAALKLVIEIDGDSHFTEQGKQYDAERTVILEGYGLKVVRFTNVEVLQSFEGVCGELLGLIPPNPP
ncbi:MAG: endonuclease domain-containing protein, partial [Planktothrix sp.]